MYIATMFGADGEHLDEHFVALIQAFGVLRTDSTLCGQPMSVSTAHAICELATAGPLHQKDLVQRLGLDSSTVSRLVDQLRTRGWAERNVDPDSDDSRLRRIDLTSSGHGVARQVLDARRKRFALLLDAIDASKRDQVLESLHLLTAATGAIT